MPRTPDEKVEWFINVYPAPGGGYYAGEVVAGRDVADEKATPGRVACVQVRFEIGEGL